LNVTGVSKLAARQPPWAGTGGAELRYSVVWQQMNVLAPTSVKPQAESVGLKLHGAIFQPCSSDGFPGSSLYSACNARQSPSSRDKIRAWVLLEQMSHVAITASVDPLDICLPCQNESNRPPKFHFLCFNAGIVDCSHSPRRMFVVSHLCHRI